MKKLFFLFLFGNSIVSYCIALFLALFILSTCESQKDIDKKSEREKAKVDSAFKADSIIHQKEFDSIKNVPLGKILK